MPFYISIFVIIFFFSALEVFGLKSNQRKVIFLLISLFLFILSFIRWETGTDWAAYIDFFYHLPPFGVETNFEPLYACLNYIGDFMFGSYTGVLLLCGIIIFSLQTVTIEKLSVLPITSLFVLWGSSLGNVFFIRQTIASAILFFSLIFIIKKKFIPFALLVIIATYFHYSSIIFLPAWWIYRLNLSKRQLIIIFIIALAVSTLVTLILNYIGGLLGGIIQYKLNVYLDNTGEDSLQGADYSLGFMLLKGLLNKAIILIPAIILKDRIQAIFRPYNGILNLYWLGAIVYFITAPISLVLVRLSFPYDMTCYLILPLLIYSIKGQLKYIAFSIMTLYLMMRMMIAINSYYDLYIPFQTCF